MKEEKHRLFNELKKVCNKEKEEKEKAEQMNTYLHPNSSYVPYQTQQPGFDSQGRILKYHLRTLNISSWKLKFERVSPIRWKENYR